MIRAIDTAVSATTTREPTGAPSVWHAGEVAMQASIGAAGMLAEVGPRVVRDRLIEQHRAFFPLLPMIVLGTVDDGTDVWATVRAGQPGFVSAPDDRTLRVEVVPERDDPAEEGLVDGAAIAVLGIESSTRRRNRLNGRIARRTGTGFDVRVEQSFGNCPKYIQRRDLAFTRDPSLRSPEASVVGDTIDATARRIVREADTFFVASSFDRPDGRQVDVSHRGGRPGFVHVADDGTLTVPDFAGNRYFNTLGNLRVNPKAGLAFVDFESGEMVQLTGDVAIVLDAPRAARFDGAERYWVFTPRRMVRRPGALPLRGTLRDDGRSPFASATGAWDDATASAIGRLARSAPAPRVAA